MIGPMRPTGLGAATADSASPRAADAPDPSSQLLSTDEIEQIAGRAQSILTATALQASYRIGELVFERVYSGNLELFRRRGRKRTSLPQVAAALHRRGLSLDATRLRKMVNRYLALEEAGIPVDDLPHVRPSHLDELLACSADERVELLLQTEFGGLTVEQTRALKDSATKPERAPAEAGDGRPPPALSSRVRSTLRTRSSTSQSGLSVKQALDSLAAHEERAEAALQFLAELSRVDRDTRVAVRGNAIRLKHLGERLESALSKLATA